MIDSDDEPNRGGRPASVMTAAKRGEITRLVALGLRPAAAARAAGISSSTMRSTKSRDPEFAQQLEEAEGRNEGGLLATIVMASKKHWVAAAWCLERRYPERWARPEVQVQLQIAATAASPQDIAAAIAAALGAVAAHHNPPGAPDVEDLVPGPPRHPHEIAAEEAQRLELERQRVVEQRARDGALVTEPSPIEQFVPLQHQFSRDEIVAATARDALRNPPR